MVFVQKTFNILSLFFFIPLVFIGAFFLLNLTLVVIKSKFTEEHENNKAIKKNTKFKQKKLSAEELEDLERAKVAYKKVKVKNQKIHDAKICRRDSDDSRAESAHKKNLRRLGDDAYKRGNVEINESLLMLPNNGKDDNRAASTLGSKSIRPLHAISGLIKKSGKNKNSMGEPITEELSNSELSMVNHNNIFYPVLQSTKGVND